MNIVDRLKEEHRVIQSMMNDLLRGPIEDSEAYSKSYIELISRLEAHERGEENTIYRELSADLTIRPLALQAMEEHRLIRQVMRDLADVEITEEVWIPRLVVANNLVSLHVQIEEGNVLELVQQSFDDAQKEDLDRRFVEEEEKLLLALRR
ncbi:MAG: hemerythrin domain-containing protein [Methanomassiliicoccus sp.]|nr:hemerythrin domain-containing protein [Methanomassiliicoccus sp.]